MYDENNIYIYTVVKIYRGDCTAHYHSDYMLSLGLSRNRQALVLYCMYQWTLKYRGYRVLHGSAEPKGNTTYSNAVRGSTKTRHEHITHYNTLETAVFIDTNSRQYNVRARIFFCLTVDPDVPS